MQQYMFLNQKIDQKLTEFIMVNEKNLRKRPKVEGFNITS